MAPNKYREHFIMIPEDVAIQSVAKEFQINYGKKQVSVEKPSGGWLSAKEKCKEISKTIITYPNRRIILLIDFDGQRESRFNEIRGEIDPVVVGNVFIFGCDTEVENLRDAGSSLRDFGRELGERYSESPIGNIVHHHEIIGNLKECERIRSALLGID